MELACGGPVSCAALALAAWSRYLGTVPAAERAPDSHGERSVELARAALSDPLAFLELDEVFTTPLRDSTTFRDAFVGAHRDLAAHGPLEAIEGVLVQAWS
jgi:mannitol-1-phosphate/altronate dehydrogenase